MFYRSRMVQCEVVGCNTRSNKEFHFYMFPTSKKRRRTWLERLNRANFNPPLNKYVYVCARHFKPEDFEPDEKNLNAKGEVRNKPKLKMLAAPSLHLKPEPEPQPELDKKTRHQRAKRTEIFTPDTSASFKREPKVQVPKVGIKPYISLYQKYRRISLKRLKEIKIHRLSNGVMKIMRWLTSKALVMKANVSFMSRILEGMITNCCPRFKCYLLKQPIQFMSQMFQKMQMK